MHARMWLIALLFFLEVAACNPQSAPDGGGGESSAHYGTPQPTALPPTDTPTQTPTNLPQTTPTPEDTPTVTPTAEPDFQICTPLPFHPVEELAEIIGDPYDPPRPGREERHHGIDLAYYHWGDRDTMDGEPVQSVLSGVVAARMEERDPYGNMVMVETARSNLPPDLVELLDIPEGESLYLLYAHLREPPLVNLGDTVEACQPLGEVGMSGFTELSHLHLETRFGPAGTVFESMVFYDTTAKQEEMDNYVLWRTSGVYQHFDPMILLSAYVDS